MKDVSALLHQYLEGTLSEQEFEELSAWIRADEANALEFTRQIALHAHLHAWLNVSEDFSPEIPAEAAPHCEPAPTVIERAIRRPTPFSMGVAAVVIGLLVAALAYIAVPYYRGKEVAEKIAPPPIVAKLSAMNNVLWERKQEKLKLHASLPEGRELNLARGLVEITFQSQAAVVVQGPAIFQLTGKNSLRLLSGRLSADVPPSAQGFVVQTEAAVFTDLGTKFTVDVASDQQAAMFVHQGKVAYQPAGGKQSSIVAAGKGVEIGPAGAVRQLATEPLAFAPLRRGVQRENLLKNGDFEARLPEDSQEHHLHWENVGKFPVNATNSGRPHGGDYCAQFSGHPRADAAIEQEIATEPGTQYVVTYFLSRLGSEKVHPTVALTVTDADSQELLAVETKIDWERGIWRAVRYRFTATSDSTLLRFAEPPHSKSIGAAPLLDSASVYAAPDYEQDNHETINKTEQEASN